MWTQDCWIEVKEHLRDSWVFIRTKNVTCCWQARCGVWRLLNMVVHMPWCLCWGRAAQHPLPTPMWGTFHCLSPCINNCKALWLAYPGSQKYLEFFWDFPKLLGGCVERRNAARGKEANILTIYQYLVLYRTKEFLAKISSKFFCCQNLPLA